MRHCNEQRLLVTRLNPPQNRGGSGSVVVVPGMSAMYGKPVVRPTATYFRNRCMSDLQAALTNIVSGPIGVTRQIPRLFERAATG